MPFLELDLDFTVCPPLTPYPLNTNVHQVTQIKGIPQMESGVPVLAEKVTANITAPVFKMGSHRP